MDEVSLLDFLHIEIHYFRELLSLFIAEEIAYRDCAYERLFAIAIGQKQILEELRNQRPMKFQSFDMKDDVHVSLLQTLKDQLDTLVIKVKDQYEKTMFAKNLKQPQLEQKEAPKKQIIVETLEDEC